MGEHFLWSYSIIISPINNSTNTLCGGPICLRFFLNTLTALATQEEYVRVINFHAWNEIEIKSD